MASESTPLSPRPMVGRMVARTVDVFIESVTGQRWSENVLLAESVYDLKERIWRTTKLPPMKQALIYSGALLSNDSLSLSSVGIRPGSTLKLVLLTRSGPTQPDPVETRRRVVGPPPPMSGGDEEGGISSDREGLYSLRRGRSQRSSAPEDTSAKESSAGETAEEHENDDGEATLARMVEASSTARNQQQKKQRTLSQSTVVHSGHTRDQTMPSTSTARCESTVGQECDQQLTTVEGGGNEDEDLSLSEMSSGVIVCDLTNEFRKLKVKRRHHLSTALPIPSRIPASSARRARSKPRPQPAAAVSREATSSDEDDERQERDEPNVSNGNAPSVTSIPSIASSTIAPSIRRAAQAVRQPRQTGFKTHAARCAVCAFKLQTSFNCRCGKILCTRHRGAHGCTKLSRGRPMTQVSD